MIPKKKKPTIRDLRTIALTNTTYKLLIGILKTTVKHHTRQIQHESEFRTSRIHKEQKVNRQPIYFRLLHQRKLQEEKPLYVIAIDFSKAFDSIKRDTLIQVLKKYIIHPKIIDHNSTYI